MEVPALVAGALGALGLLALSFFFRRILVGLRRVAKERLESAQQRYPHARHIDAGANSFGQRSLGKWQVRGNGTLILTEAELIFEQWVPAREFRIPLRAISSIETPRGFLGKTHGVPLLAVEYLNEVGEADALAWRVMDLSAWIRRLEEAGVRSDRATG